MCKMNMLIRAYCFAVWKPAIIKQPKLRHLAKNCLPVPCLHGLDSSSAFNLLRRLEVSSLSLFLYLGGAVVVRVINSLW